MEDGRPILQRPGLLPSADPHDLAARNLQAALLLLRALVAAGLRHLVLCPGSRSAPLAAAAGLLAEREEVELFTAIDERSAAFFALGIGRASGLPAAVLTTSGTAVANLLPAAVEADYGTVPLLLITADRPARLKGCGANQTVNQECFLAHSVRWFGQGPAAGLDQLAPAELRALADRALAACLGDGGSPPGAVHLNLPLEEPLHAGALALQQSCEQLRQAPLTAAADGLAEGDREPLDEALSCQVVPPSTLGVTTPAAPGPAQALPAAPLDPDRPGLLVAGPWRGRPQHWAGHLQALERLQRRTGWPLLADGLSGLRGLPQLQQVAAYDLLAEQLPAELEQQLGELQALRLGPLPASRRLQTLLQRCGGAQVLVSEGDLRPLDPLGRCHQAAAGLASWWQQLPPHWQQGQPSAEAGAAARPWLQQEQRLQAWLDQALSHPSPSAAGSAALDPPWSEPQIARRLAALLPAGVPLMIANSSPVRDWESFVPATAPPRPVYSFRGASGIDGTLSLACGLAAVAERAVLLSGDLALLHDSNGWLWHAQLPGRLTVVLIDNGGGGIFEQLPIRQPAAAPLDFERLFAMPQAVDPLALAAAHGVPGQRLQRPEELEPALAWAQAHPMALLVLRSDRRRDAERRRELRRMAAALVSSPLP